MTVRESLSRVAHGSRFVLWLRSHLVQSLTIAVDLFVCGSGDLMENLANSREWLYCWAASPALTVSYSVKMEKHGPARRSEGKNTVQYNLMIQGPSLETMVERNQLCPQSHESTIYILCPNKYKIKCIVLKSGQTWRLGVESHSS